MQIPQQISDLLAKVQADKDALDQAKADVAARGAALTQAQGDADKAGATVAQAEQHLASDLKSLEALLESTYGSSPPATAVG